MFTAILSRVRRSGVSPPLHRAETCPLADRRECATPRPWARTACAPQPGVGGRAIALAASVSRTAKHPALATVAACILGATAVALAASSAPVWAACVVALGAAALLVWVGCEAARTRRLASQQAVALNAAGSQRAAAQTAFEMLQAARDTVQHANEGLQADYSALLAVRDALQQQYTALQTADEGLQADHARLQVAHTALQCKGSAAALRIESLQLKLATQSEHLRCASAAAVVLRDEMAQLRRALHQAQADCGQWERKTAQLRAGHAEIVSRLEADIATLHAERDVLRMERGSVAAELDPGALESEYERLQEQHRIDQAALACEFEALYAETHDLHALRTQHLHDVDRLAVDAHDLRQRAAQLTKRQQHAEAQDAALSARSAAVDAAERDAARTMEQAQSLIEQVLAIKAAYQQAFTNVEGAEQAIHAHAVAHADAQRTRDREAKAAAQEMRATARVDSATIIEAAYREADELRATTLQGAHAQWLARENRAR